MIKNKIYYLLLGLGLGIIITSSLNIAFDKTEKIVYTDEEIKEKAKDLGMISIKENIEKNDKEKNEVKPQPKVEPKEEVQEVSNPDPVVETPPEAPQSQAVLEGEPKTLTIVPEDSASTIISKLKTNGIIDSEEEFKKLVVQYNLQRKFRSGTYEIKQNSTYADVLNKLINENDLKNAGLL